jgi:hypothetical protein
MAGTNPLAINPPAHHCPFNHPCQSVHYIPTMLLHRPVSTCVLTSHHLLLHCQQFFILLVDEYLGTVKNYNCSAIYTALFRKQNKLCLDFLKWFFWQCQCISLFCHLSSKNVFTVKNLLKTYFWLWTDFLGHLMQYTHTFFVLVFFYKKWKSLVVFLTVNLPFASKLKLVGITTVKSLQVETKSQKFWSQNGR